jgi:hypothetical protein
MWLSRLKGNKLLRIPIILLPFDLDNHIQLSTLRSPYRVYSLRVYKEKKITDISDILL